MTVAVTVGRVAFVEDVFVRTIEAVSTLVEDEAEVEPSVIIELVKTGNSVEAERHLDAEELVEAEELVGAEEFAVIGTALDNSKEEIV